LGEDKHKLCWHDKFTALLLDRRRKQLQAQKEEKKTASNTTKK
jgi:hypothetical protein